MRELDYFIGKICTIFTSPINRDYKQENPTTYPEQLYNYFMGRIISISEQGILLQQVTSSENLKTYLFLGNIIGIAEELELDPNRPENAQVINEIKAANQKARKEIETMAEPKDKFINIQTFSDMSKKLEKTFKKNETP